MEESGSTIESVLKLVSYTQFIAFSEVIITYAFKKVLIYLLPENLEPTSLVQLISTDYKFVVSYSILLLVLIFRPTGIFRGKSV